MKKRIAAALVLLCLMMGTACCAQAFDLSPYVIHSNELLSEYEARSEHTALVEWDAEKQYLLIFDGDGNRLCRQSLGMEKQYDAAVTADHPQGGCLAALVRGGMIDGSLSMCIRRIDENGKLLWEGAVPKGFSYNWDILCDDGQGGAFFVFADPDNYKLAQVWHWDAQGNLLWNKVIEAQGLIFSGFSGRFDGNKDRLVIGGHAVSRSRGIYDVLVLEIDREGDMRVAQRKDFSCRPDYGFDVLMDDGGAFYAHSYAEYLDTKGTPRVLVPVDILPDAPQRAVELRDEPMPQVYYYNTNGGRRYHVQEHCGSIDEKYYDFIEQFDAAQLGQLPYGRLTPCSYCGADR